MRKACILLVLMVWVGSAFGITVDGSISDWNSAYIHTDSPTDKANASSLEMVQWGAYSDGATLYFFGQFTGDYNFNHFMEIDPSNGKKRLYLSVFVDADRSDATSLTGNTHQGQWPSPHAGIDVNIEWGTRRAEDHAHFWGKDDNVDSYGSDVTPVGHSDYIMEFSCPVSLLDTELATYPDHATRKRVVKLGIGMQASDYSTVGYGWDHGSVIYLPVNTVFGDASEDGTVDVSDLGILAANYGGSGKAWETGDFNNDGLVDVSDLGILAANYGGHYTGVPEPLTIGLLGLGAMGLLRRKN